MTAGLPSLWLVRYAGESIVIAAANDRDTACRLAHGLVPDVPYCDFSTLHIGTSKQAKVVVIADLRPPASRPKEIDGTAPHVDTHPSRRRVGHKPGPRAPACALAAFSALCEHFGVSEHVARSSHTPAATRLRWAIWSACLGAGYNQRQAADVTGHNNCTVSKTIVDLERGNHSDKTMHPETIRAYQFAVAAMRAEITGRSDEAEPAVPC